MRSRNLHQIFFIICSLIIILLCSACTQNIPNAQEISDAEFVKIAKKTTEARLFIKMYPEAETEVDRSGRLAVDFRYDPDPLELGEYIRLRVFIDPSILKVIEDDLFLERRIHDRSTFTRRPNIVDELKKGLTISE